MENNSTTKDLFLHLLNVGALYMSAVAIITLLFQYINIYLPDPLQPLYYQSVAGSIRWSMAVLIIVFPLYMYISKLLQQDYSANLEKKELKIRKWLVYLTLFIAAIVITVDLVTLVYNFLGGDLTMRFFFKIIVVLGVATEIFIYYLWDLKNIFSGNQLRNMAWIVSGFILVAVVFGFFSAGSPLKARMVRFDEERVNDLVMIQAQLVNYWQQKDKLPDSLGDLRDSLSGFAVPQDPATGEDYGYVKSGDLSFSLCTTFDLSSDDILGQSIAARYEKAYQENWDHEAGEMCFEREIDPELYGGEENRFKPLPVY